MISASAARLLVGVSFLGLADAAAAQQQQPAAPAEQAGGLQDIVVTAEKREASVNKVPMSITAVTGDALQRQGVTEVRDLEKVVPGFKYTEGTFAAPVYSLRGVGFNDSSLASRPTVSIYVDEIPIPFSTLTRGASLDVERVEVLKGPQGTLFGQNATGGAINYIAAKPTESFKAGLTAGIGRFDYRQANGYVSGPIAPTLSARVAVNGEWQDGWQRSATRPGDRLGSVDFLQGRVLLDWKPGDRFSAELNLNGYRDKTENQAAQFLQFLPRDPSQLPLLAAIAGTDPRAADIIKTSQMRGPRSDNRDADWTPDIDYHRNDRFYQAALTMHYELSDTITLTSLSSYLRFKRDHVQDFDGVAQRATEITEHGRVKSFSQELRLNGSAIDDRLKWIVGGNYEHSNVDQIEIPIINAITSSYTFVPLGLPYFSQSGGYSLQKSVNKAGFANVDFALTDSINLHGGARYTKSNTRFRGCSVSGEDGALAADLGGLYSILRAAAGLGPVTIAPGGCVTADATFLPGEVSDKLDEHNVSWRAGVDWTPVERTLLYANVSQGFKTGNFPLVQASSAAQFAPVKQEKLVSYEVGFKSTLFDRTLQLNGALFYYDYSDKQVRGVQLVFPFGPLETLLNVPKSRLKGAEFAINWAPVRNLALSAGGVYLDSRVKGDFTSLTFLSETKNFGGERLPLTPKWQLSGSADYTLPLSERLNAFVGSSLSYQSGTNAAFGEIPLFRVRGYTLLDLRAGLETADKAWRLEFWGRNVTNRYYWTNVFYGGDEAIRFTGRPATYGASISWRY